MASSSSMNFPQFDVTTDYRDHVYADFKPFANSSVAGKRIMKEWRSLGRDLPESIYVRVYEGRIDLMRAVIIGASGTPYHDGLFFFDLHFPNNYPNHPPEVRFRSFGFRLNPNLYHNGMVCLSLLNTWDGPHWDSSRSTVLQVLVSLQGLVLKANPYYNEPGLGLFKGKFGSMSRAYDNDVFLKSCYVMRHLLRNPPRGFEGFVADYFRRRSRAILTACRVYAEGFLRVGEYQENGSFRMERVKVEKKFKKSILESVYPLLVTWFSMNDPSLKGFVIELNEMIVKTKEEYDRVKEPKKKEKLTTKLIKMVTSFWRSNKCIKGNVGDGNGINGRKEARSGPILNYIAFI